MKKRVSYIGEKFTNMYGEVATVIDEEKDYYATVQFDNGVIKKLYVHNLRRGAFKSPYSKSIMGVGCLGDLDEIPDKKILTEWRKILEKCFADEYFMEFDYSLICKEWLNFSNYYKWRKENYCICEGHISICYRAVSENMYYSPKTCIAVPHAIDKLLARNNISIDEHKQLDGTYKLSSHIDGKNVIITSDNEDEFKSLYCKLRNRQIRSLVKSGKYSITPEAYALLSRYRFRFINKKLDSSYTNIYNDKVVVVSNHGETADVMGPDECIHTVTSASLINGTFKLPTSKCAYGIGYLGYEQSMGKSVCKLWSYRLWEQIIKSVKSAIKYEGVLKDYICNEWLNFSIFKKWYDRESAKYGHSLILYSQFIGKMYYSKDTVILIPKEIHNYINKQHLNYVGFKDGIYSKAIVSPITKKKHTYRSRILDEMMNNYKVAFNNGLLYLIDQYKDVIPVESYDKLLNFDIRDILG